MITLRFGKPCPARFVHSRRNEEKGIRLAIRFNRIPFLFHL
ncbi:hypothetical protein RMSM_04458 [Rhodopirellula maiorica SM1]|uniref:Uncharacterized protein n=1 Tax=Rhodopirellula maiorica SM1 TaxID=1265738 RepID=M5RXC7_9BACT|nr:hypothetical protein RMSM_04458 [Rhodopirellula maiorica SM1]